MLHKLHYYRLQRSCGQGYVFTRVCDSAHRRGGGFSRQGEPPLAGGRTPPDQADSPGRREEPPRTRQTTLDQAEPPGRENPPGKQTPEYGLRAAGTHPTGMHSCYSHGEYRDFQENDVMNVTSTLLSRHVVK